MTLTSHLASKLTLGSDFTLPELSLKYADLTSAVNYLVPPKM